MICYLGRSVGVDLFVRFVVEFVHVCCVFAAGVECCCTYVGCGFVDVLRISCWVGFGCLVFVEFVCFVLLILFYVCFAI